MCLSFKCLRWTVFNICFAKKMAVMGHDGPWLPFDVKFPFQSKSALLKSNFVNKMTNQPGK